MSESRELTIVKEIRAALEQIRQGRPEMAATLLLALCDRLLDEQAARNPVAAALVERQDAALH